MIVGFPTSPCCIKDIILFSTVVIIKKVSKRVEKVIGNLLLDCITNAITPKECVVLSDCPVQSKCCLLAIQSVHNRLCFSLVINIYIKFDAFSNMSGHMKTAVRKAKTENKLAFHFHSMNI